MKYASCAVEGGSTRAVKFVCLLLLDPTCAGILRDTVYKSETQGSYVRVSGSVYQELLLYQ